MPLMLIFMIIMIAATVVMALMAKGQNLATAANLTDFNFPIAQQGAAVPLILGTVRMTSPNTIWYGDYGNSPIQTCQSTFGIRTCSTTGYKYYIGLDEALCLGPDVKIITMWCGKDVVFQIGTIAYGTGSDASTEAGNYAIFTDDTLSTPMTLPITTTTRFYINAPNLFGGPKSAGGLSGWVTFYAGEDDETQSAYVERITGDPSLPQYNGICRMVFESFYIGTTTSLGAFNFELQRLTDDLNPGYGIVFNGMDLNCLEVAYQLITSTWGGWGMSADQLDLPSWQAASVTLYNEGNGMSLSLQSDKTIQNVLDTVCNQMDGFIFQNPTTTLLTVKLVRQDYSVPDLLVINQSDITEMSSFMKSTWDSTFNQVRCNFSNRVDYYKPGVACGQDFANINYQGKLNNNTITAEGVKDPSVANIIVMNGLIATCVPLYKIEIKCNRNASTLLPGDCFVLNYSPYNLSEMVFRVLNVDLGSLEDGTVAISAIQDKFAANTILFAPPAATLWHPNPQGQPKAIVTSAAIEMPYFLQHRFNQTITIADGTAKVYYLANSPSSLSTAFNAQLSLDSFATYADELTEADYSNTATLTATYSATAGGTSRFDTVGFTVGNVTNTAILNSDTTISDYTDGRGLCQIDAELISYSGYTNNGDGTYTLLNIQRGFLDTLPASHSTGAYLWFLGTNASGMGAGLWPDTSSTKWREMDQRGAAGYPDTSAAQSVLTLAQRAQSPLCPSYLCVNGSRTPSPISDVGTVTISWYERNRFDTVLSWYASPTVTPEAGVTYTITYTVNGGSPTSITGLTGTSYALDATHISGNTVISIVAVRGGITSQISDTIDVAINEAGAGYGYDYGVAYG
jgi:Putative phage tail protein